MWVGEKRNKKSLKTLSTPLVTLIADDLENRNPFTAVGGLACQLAVNRLIIFQVHCCQGLVGYYSYYSATVS